MRRLLPALAAAALGTGRHCCRTPTASRRRRRCVPATGWSPARTTPPTRPGWWPRPHRGPEGCPAPRLRAAPPRPRRPTTGSAVPGGGCSRFPPRTWRGCRCWCGPWSLSRRCWTCPAAPGRPLRRRRADHLRAAPLYRPGADPAQQGCWTAVEVAALAGLDAVLVGGAGRRLRERAAAAGIRLVTTYGMSETCAVRLRRAPHWSAGPAGQPADGGLRCRTVPAPDGARAAG